MKVGNLKARLKTIVIKTIPNIKMRLKDHAITHVNSCQESRERAANFPTDDITQSINELEPNCLKSRVFQKKRRL